MSKFWQWILGSSLLRTQIMKFVANIAAKVGVALAALIVGYLLKHGYSVDQAMSQHIALVGTAAASLIGAAAQVLYDVVIDPKRVNVALQATASAGEVVTPQEVKGLKVGDIVTAPSGQAVVIGKPSPSGQTSAQEEAETAALNEASKNGV